MGATELLRMSSLIGLVQAHPAFVLAFLIIFLFALIAHIFSPKVQAEEPPLVYHPIPLIGHLVELFFSGVQYFDRLAVKTGHEIFTVTVLTSKVYVVASPALTTACMRENRTLSFNPFIVEFFRRMAGLSHDTMAVTKENMDSKEIPSYMSDMHRVEYSALAPGPALDRMNERALTSMAGFLNNNVVVDEPLQLFATLKKMFTMASVRATYGPKNPFDEDPQLFNDFWFFESQIKRVILNVCPHILFRKAYLARQRLVDAFKDYYARGAYTDASAVVKERLAVAQKWEQSMHVIAAFDVGIVMGILANAMPSVFWMLAHAYESPSVLSTIRKETAGFVDTTSDEDSVSVNLPADPILRRGCPILTSLFHETLRHGSASLSSGRFVLSDSVVTSFSPSFPTESEKSRTYVLKAGCAVQIPSQSLHYSTDKSSPFGLQRWLRRSNQVPTSEKTDSGETASQSDEPFSIRTFRPSLFSELGAVEPERSMNGHFRAFGGGATLCPGRKFAFMEIVGFVTMFIHLFEVEQQVTNAGISHWRDGVVDIPGLETAKVAIAVAKPDREIVVRLKRRDGLEGKKLKVSVDAQKRVDASRT